jgi:hypothetical protein
MGQKNANDSSLYKILSKFEDKISKLRKDARQSSTEKRKYDYALQIRDLAREALKIKKDNFDSR